jgi:predicted dinucleotide-binding enzyme
MSGDSADAKRQVREVLEAFGWTDIIDLGDIATARATEDHMPLWMALWKVLGTAHFNIKVIR